MSNKRNRRRKGQRVRAEISRRPVKVTKASTVLVASQPAERERKEWQRKLRKPTKAERQAHEKAVRRWRLRGPSKVRKPRTKYGNTYWNHSHDI